jgi:hypothetical protein
MNAVSTAMPHHENINQFTIRTVYSASLGESYSDGDSGPFGRRSARVVMALGRRLYLVLFAHALSRLPF